jgi:hypothetical protein
MFDIWKWSYSCACPETWWWEGVAALIMNLKSRWIRVFNFTFWTLYSQEKSSWYPLNGRLGEAQRWSGSLGKRISGFRPQIVQLMAQSLCWLYYSGFLCCDIDNYKLGAEMENDMFQKFFISQVPVITCIFKYFINYNYIEVTMHTLY